MPRPLVLATLALAACSTGGGEPTPSAERRAQVPDEVGAVDAARLVGTWQCRPLDPPGENRPAVEQTLTFAGDGSGKAASSVDMASMGQSGRYLADSTFDWAAGGDGFTIANLRTDVRAGDDGAMTGFMAGLAQTVVRVVGTQSQIGNSDVLRLDRQALMFRPAGRADGPVTSCERR